MRTNRGTSITLMILAVAGITFAEPGSGDSVKRIDNAPILSVTLQTDKGDAVMSVDGSTVTAEELRDMLRAKLREKPQNMIGPGEFCELRVGGDVPYSCLADALIACAQADIHNIVFNTKTESLSYRMPAVDRGSGGEVIPRFRMNVGVSRKDGKTAVTTGSGAPLILDGSKERIADLATRLERVHADFAKDGQVILVPAADVPSEDVLRIYDACTRAKFVSVGFAPAGSTMPQTAPAARNGRFSRRIVYIVDRSAGVAASFDKIREEVVRGCNNLIPVQNFNIILLGEKAEPLFPNILRPVPDVKKQVGQKMREVKAEGSIDGKLEPFRDAFEKAFAMKPELIYFVSGSAFDPKLQQAVAELNKDGKVKIFVVAYATDRKTEEQYRELAKQNGGLYKYVAPSDVQSPTTQSR